MAFSVLPGSEAPDAVEMARAVAAGEVARDHWVRDAVERARRIDPDLNAIIHPRFDQALELARAPHRGVFAGVPFAVKDLGCEQAGEPHHRGTRFLRDAGWIAEQDSYLWRRFSDAGLVSLGRTNAPEFGSTITTEPLSTGPTRNPWDPSLTPGGSSGGAAALVAAGVVPVAHGNDGGGSLRVPAAMCGLVGLKPSRGRVSVGPQSGTSLGGFAVDGVVTRTVRDAAVALDVMAGAEPGDPYTATPPPRPYAATLDASEPSRLRIGVVRRRLHPVVGATLTAAATLLADLGHEILVDTMPRGWFSPEVVDGTTVVRAVGMAHTIDGWERRLGRRLGDGDVEPQNLYAAELGRFLTAQAFVAAREDLQAWTRQVVPFWDEFDLLLSPVVGAPTPELGFLSDPLEGQQRLFELLGFVDQANVTGQPAISLPLGRDDRGMPVGVQLIAAPQREDVLLSIAAQVERAV